MPPTDPAAAPSAPHALGCACRGCYRIKSLGASSSQFGPCEVCGAHVSEVFLQVGMTRSGGDLFGHRACLVAARRSWEKGRAESARRAEAKARSATGGTP